MTKSELISKGKHKVRNTPSLMSVYIELYSTEFGRKPVCAGCTFNEDWQRFVGGKKTGEAKMVTVDTGRTFKFKQPSTQLLSYRDGTIHRKYANKASDHFITQYLTHGSAEEIAERMKLFAILPEQMREKPTVEVKPKRTNKTK